MRLDVIDVLYDPEFQDTIDVIRNQEVIDNSGVVTFVPNTIRNVKAVVTQQNGDLMRREMAGQFITGTIVVYTTFELSAGRDIASRELGADVVRYPSGSEGDQYTVTKLKDYSRYGRGFYIAVCETLNLEPTARAK